MLRRYLWWVSEHGRCSNDSPNIRPYVLTLKDPVCGMEVNPHSAKYVAAPRGQTYLFCSLMCQKAFENDPLFYLNQGRRDQSPTASTAGS